MIDYVPDYYPFNMSGYYLFIESTFTNNKQIVLYKKPTEKLDEIRQKFNIQKTVVEIGRTINIISNLIDSNNQDSIQIRNKLIDGLLKYNTVLPPAEEPIKTFNEQIESLDDLLAVCKKYENDNAKYTIDTKILKRIHKPLKALSETIGMVRVKDQVVDHVLCSLLDLYDEDQMFHTVIQGPPGVGKTMLAKILGELYSNMGVLKGNKFSFNIARRSDLVGRYLGHTAKQTQEFIDKCEGGVMFIDEVYSLGNSEKRDSYAKECIDTINLNLTEKKNFICIIAGYPEEINDCFFVYNSGLKRRFPFVYDIENYTSEQLADIFIGKIDKIKWKLDTNKKQIVKFFEKNMKQFPHFGGDVENLILNIKSVHGRRVFGKDKSLRKIIIMDDINAAFSKLEDSKELMKKDEPPASMYI